MPRWTRYWVVGSLVYVTPLVVVLVQRPELVWWWNALVVLGPPLLALGVGWLVCRDRTVDAWPTNKIRPF